MALLLFNFGKNTADQITVINTLQKSIHIFILYSCEEYRNQTRVENSKKIRAKPTSIFL